MRLRISVLALLIALGGPAAAQVLPQGATPITGNSAGTTGASVNTAITITTTANGTATAVDVNSWGYVQ